MDNINLKRKVTLKRKSDKDDQLPEDKKPNKVIPIIIISIILLLGISWFYNREKDDVNVETNTTVESTPQESISKDSVSTVVSTDAVNEVTPDSVVNTVSTESTDPGNTNKVSDPNKSTSETSVGRPKSRGMTTNTSVSKDYVDNKARQVIDGVFGNGEDRKSALGAEYEAIQEKVNEMYRNR